MKVTRNESTDLFGNAVINSINVEREDLAQALEAMFKDMQLEDFVALLTSEFVETVEYLQLCSGERRCQKTSLLFNAHRLNVRSLTSKRSIFEAIQTENFCNGLARAILTKATHVRELLYQSMQMGVNGIQYINEFPPHVARDLAIEFKLSSTSRILDPCAGWGGRMIGLTTVCDNYQAFEPSTKTFDGLLRLSSWLRKFNDDLNVELQCVPFEDAEVDSDVFDFALTSPPYYDTEHYAPNEETNSMNKFATFDDWCDGFYLPMIEKTMRALKKDSSFILNIGSRKYPLNEVLTSNFSERFEVRRLKSRLSASTGLGKSGEGETFYCVTK